jgi:hypothetical protein
MDDDARMLAKQFGIVKINRGRDSLQPNTLDMVNGYAC